MSALWPCLYENGKWVVGEQVVMDSDDIWSSEEFPNVRPQETQVVHAGEEKTVRLWITDPERLAYAAIEDIWPLVDVRES